VLQLAQARQRTAQADDMRGGDEVAVAHVERFELRCRSERVDRGGGQSAHLPHVEPPQRRHRRDGGEPAVGDAFARGDRQVTQHGQVLGDRAAHVVPVRTAQLEASEQRRQGANPRGAFRARATDVELAQRRDAAERRQCCGVEVVRTRHIEHAQLLARRERLQRPLGRPHAETIGSAPTTLHGCTQRPHHAMLVILHAPVEAVDHRQVELLDLGQLRQQRQLVAVQLLAAAQHELPARRRRRSRG
jgi:hypothetical protein